MNKRIKRIIAMALVLGTFSSVAPNKYFDILMTKAYASSDGYKDYGIENLEIVKGSASSEEDDEEDDDALTLYTSSSYDNSTGFEMSQYEYYAKTSEDSINIKVTKVSGCNYKIFKSGSSKEYSSADKLDLKEGDNIFYVRTYENGDFNEKKIEENQIRCYEVHVQRKSASNVSLKDISLSEGTISFSKSKLSYNVEVESKVNEITITAKPEDIDYTVKIDGTNVSDSDNFRKKISLNKGKNTIKIELGGDSDNGKIYTVNIYRGTTAASAKAIVEYGPTDYSQPSVYLEDLQLNSGDISFEFKKNVSIYNVRVDSTVEEMYVIAKPDSSNDKVEINDKKLTSDKDYEASLKNLVSGKNAFTIKVTNSDGNSRNYTLNIYRGTDVQNTTTSTISTTEAVKPNQWVQVNGRWQYNDKDGKPYKNQLFYDNNYKNTYYLNADGFMETGWKLFNGKYYYADNSGAIQKGWLKLGTVWYHLDLSTGAMDTGWYTDNGKWYYSDPSGAMAYDTYIGNFKLGLDGAWIQ